MNNNYFLFLEFIDAGFFPYPSKSKDFIFDLNGKRKRVDGYHFDEPITVYQISNVLHVLGGERPVPTLRKTVLSVIPEIYKMAYNGYLQITTPKFEIGKTGKFKYPTETKTMRKSVYNSFSKSASLINWERIKRLLEDDLYIKFLTLLKDLFKVEVVKKYTAEEAMELLRNNNFIDDKRVVDFIELLRKNGKQPMIDFIYGQQKVSQNMLLKKPDAVGAKPTFNGNSRTLITTPLGIDKITRLRGKIIIPINDWYLSKVRENKGFATILDGGLVWIDKLISADDMSDRMIEDFIKISDISTNITKNINKND